MAVQTLWSVLDTLEHVGEEGSAPGHGLEQVHDLGRSERVSATWHRRAKVGGHAYPVREDVEVSVEHLSPAAVSDPGIACEQHGQS